MVIVALAAAAATIVLMILSNIISTQLQLITPLRIVVQIVIVAVGAQVAFHLGLVSAIVAAGMIATPFLLNGLSYGLIVFQQRRARSGKYGEEVRWATELIDNEDEYFKYVISQMPRREMREIGIIAETKDELRELTIERFEEISSNDTIPERFMS